MWSLSGHSGWLCNLSAVAVTLALCLISSFRWNAAAAGRRRPAGARPAPTELAVGPDAPRVVTPRIDPQVPVFALGRYAGARRQAIVAMKDRGRADLITPLARALAVGVHRLLSGVC